MGTGFDLSCTNCGHSKKIMFGVGMMYGYITADLIRSNVRSKNYQNKILLRIDRGKQPEICEHVLMKCAKCQSVYERLYVRFGDGFVTEYKCPKCKSQLEQIEEDKVEHTKCPKCGQNTITITGFILWD